MCFSLLLRFRRAATKVEGPGITHTHGFDTDPADSRALAFPLYYFSFFRPGFRHTTGGVDNVVVHSKTDQSSTRAKPFC